LPKDKTGITHTRTGKSDKNNRWQNGGMGRDWKAELWGRFGFRESQSAAGTEVLLPDGLKAAEITRSAAPFKSVKAVKKKLNKKKNSKRK